MDLISFNIFYIHWYCKLEGHFCQTPHLTPAAAGQASSKRWAWKLLTTNSPESWKPSLCLFCLMRAKVEERTLPRKLLSSLNKLLCLCVSDCFALLHFSTLSKWCLCLLPRCHFFIRQVQWDIASAVTLPWIRAAAEALLHDTCVASRRGYKEFTGPATPHKVRRRMCHTAPFAMMSKKRMRNKRKFKVSRTFNWNWTYCTICMKRRPKRKKHQLYASLGLKCTHKTHKS